MSFSVRLTRAGLRHEAYRDGRTRVRIHRPRTLADLLRFWHYQLDAIDSDVTLGDLLALLRRVRGVGRLSAMVSCDLPEFLAEAELPAASPAGDLDYLEVYNTAELEGFDGDRFHPPYAICRGFHGWGAWERPDDLPDDDGDDWPTEGGFAIEFTPVNELVHLPLRYDPAVRFDRERYSEPLFETKVTITFGEFVHAVLWEIGFFGSPGDRNEQRAGLQATMAEVDEAMERGEVPCDSVDMAELLDALDRGDEDDSAHG
jgi:hypothetical protein